MALTRPGPTLGATPPGPIEESHCAPTPTREGDAAGGQVLPFPVAHRWYGGARCDRAHRGRTKPRCRGAARRVSGRWVAEAAVTAGPRWTGRCWRSRPAAPTDVAALMRTNGLSMSRVRRTLTARNRAGDQ